MKNIFWIATVFLILVACGDQDSNEVGVDPEEPALEQVVDDALDDAAER